MQKSSEAYQYVQQWIESVHKDFKICKNGKLRKNASRKSREAMWYRYVELMNALVENYYTGDNTKKGKYKIDVTKIYFPEALSDSIDLLLERVDPFAIFYTPAVNKELHGEIAFEDDCFSNEKVKGY